ncbi:hypothetical protein ENBRE01_0308 [Enteropsectra breve]|nr:hypothetical protein ENBRE01_0308 [Enteropsectra breve]
MDQKSTKTSATETVHKKEKKVSWTAETIDNEHMNKKSSKICCIHHSKYEKDCLDRTKNKYER